jgi:endonuclease/exonuclease/phosphatase family metal-dependent hydrolase
VTRFIRLVGVAVAMWIVLAQTAGLWWPGELACHWAWHAGVMLLPVMIAVRKQKAECFGAFALIVIAWRPYLLAQFEERAPDRVEGTTFTLAHANVLFDSDRRDRAFASLQETDDVVSLVELVDADRVRWDADPRWPTKVWNTDPRYRSGVALLSRLPLQWSLARDLEGSAAIEAVLDAHGRPLRVIVAHIDSPMSPRRLARRDRQLQLIAQIAVARPEPLMVIGDFNITIASPSWLPFVEAGHLRRGAGLEPGTWPSLLGCAGITIDHILVSEGVGLSDQRSWWVTGSDHRGVRASIVVAGSKSGSPPP